MVKNKSSGYLIKSAVKILNVLEYLADNGSCTATEITEKLEIPQSTVFNLLFTLEETNYVKQIEENKKYRLTTKILEISNKLNFKLRDITRPYLKRLSQETNEGINLAIRAETKILPIEKIESSRTIKISSKIGQKEGIYCTSIGKAILANLDNNTQKYILNNINFRSITPNTITSKEELENQIIKIKKLGYAVDEEEFCLGVKCIGAPVFDHKGEVLAAISITAPVDRLNKNEQTYVALLKKACNEASRDLGCSENRLII